MVFNIINNDSSFNSLLKRDLPPVALILAGYNKIDAETKRKSSKELREAYDGDIIYMGENKFLRPLAGKPVIQYVIDAVYNAKKGGRRLYDKIYVYNDKKIFEEVINISQYDNLFVNQMKDSVGGHWKDFYNYYVDYGQRIDVFFGDTPRITPEDVEYLHNEYEKIIGIQTDYRGVPVSVVFNIVDFKDMSDTWLPHRLKYIKVGKNKGKLKSFVGFENYQARVGNSGAMIKDPCLDDIMNYEVVNFAYNLRKALTPNIFAKIMYSLWKTRRFDMIKQIRNRNLNETVLFSTAYDVISNIYKIDLSRTAGTLFHIKKNASRWENDIDGPKDYEAFQKMFTRGTSHN
ncbi:MAG TPA: hypothetical protein PK926_06690 [Spirochaetota bacterium]|nr:hypothetical protein [Spirochaetota bacterium]HPI89597.1 hypothetical protein [Spirochaetota bacterium]HPR48056.1 hypothetical protein [Spirochaetota bacterium]